MLPQQISQILNGEDPYLSTPAEYRQSAELCLEVMRGSASLETRAALVSLAQQWIELAERAEYLLARQPASALPDLTPPFPD